jgi:hypothetical protein
MLTRRQVLVGTAASSIAAIASARGVAAAAPGAAGFDIGVGGLQDGAAVAFHKEELGFSFFIKLRDSAAQIFYKEEMLGEIGVFLKFFPKVEPADAAFSKHKWMLVDQFGGFLKNVAGAEAGFSKVAPTVAQIFLKFEIADQQWVEDVRTLENGMLLPAVDVCEPKLE